MGSLSYDRPDVAACDVRDSQSNHHRTTTLAVLRVSGVISHGFRLCVCVCWHYLSSIHLRLFSSVGITRALKGATTPVSPWTDISHACWFATTPSPFGFSTAGNWTTTDADLSTHIGQVWLVISTVPHWSYEFAEFHHAGLFTWTTVHGTLISRNGGLQG